MTDRELHEHCQDLIFSCRLFLHHNRKGGVASELEEVRAIIRKAERRLRELGDPVDFDDEPGNHDAPADDALGEHLGPVPPSAEGTVRTRGTWDDYDRLAVSYFGRELDEWGSIHRHTGRYHDPFLHAVLRSSDVHDVAYRALTRAFNTLDDMLTATPDGIAAVKGVGPKAIALLEAELARLGHRKTRRSVQS